jgi:hypothetical protein
MEDGGWRLGGGNMSLYNNHTQSLPAFTCRFLYLPLPLPAVAFTCRCLYLPLPLPAVAFTCRCLYLPLPLPAFTCAELRAKTTSDPARFGAMQRRRRRVWEWK